MSDKNEFRDSEPFEELSAEELLAQAEHAINGTPDGAYAQTHEPVLPADDFAPDFGDAFADYGEYVAETPVPPVPEDYPDYDDDMDEELPPPEKPKRRSTGRIVPLFVKVLLYVVIVGLIAVGLGYGIWECAEDVLALGRSEESVSVTLEDGVTLDEIADMLEEKGIIKYPWLFKLYCDFTDSTDTMEPGNYVLYYNYDYHALVNGMAATSPNRTEVRVMIPEGYTAAQIFALMEREGVCSAEELEKCAASEKFDYWFLEGIPYGAANRLEGFLFPDTYDFYENDNPVRVIQKLLNNFEDKFSDDAAEQLEKLNVLLAERLAAAGYDESYIAAHRFSIYELMTVASMIEKETASMEESRNISAVIYNRLCRPADFPYLNIDATVVYALGGVSGALTYEDLQVDSPYNTYNHTGLPAGPISNPGLSSITAALNPLDNDYYYYALDRETGFHHFSETYDEHNRFLESQNGDE